MFNLGTIQHPSEGDSDKRYSTALAPKVPASAEATGYLRDGNLGGESLGSTVFYKTSETLREGMS